MPTLNIHYTSTKPPLVCLYFDVFEVLVFNVFTKMRYSYAEILKKINRYFSGGLVEVKWRYSVGLVEV